MLKTSIDFSNNINFCRPRLSLPAKQWPTLISQYPDPNNFTLKKSVSKFLKINAASIELTVGTTEIFKALPKAYGNVGLCCSPTFWEYEGFFKEYHGTKCYTVALKEENNFEINYRELRKELSRRRVDICYLGHPNNPTGNCQEKEHLLKIIKNFTGTLFVVDETYLPFTPNFHRLSLAQSSTKFPNLIVALSLSKIFAIPGLRCGICCSSKENIGHLKKWFVSYGQCSLNQYLVPGILNNPKFLAETWSKCRKSRRAFENYINKHMPGSVKIFGISGAFLLVKLAVPNVRKNIVEFLKKNGVIVRPGTEFAGLGSNWFRASIRSPREMLILADLLEKFIQG